MIKTDRNLCCFLTDDFKPVFLETLKKNGYTTSQFRCYCII